MAIWRGWCADMATSDSGSPIELRGQAPRTLVDVLDAVSAHRRITRWELITQVLEEWADDRMRETTAIIRVTGSFDGMRGDR